VNAHGRAPAGPLVTSPLPAYWPLPIRDRDNEGTPPTTGIRSARPPSTGLNLTVGPAGPEPLAPISSAVRIDESLTGGAAEDVPLLSQAASRASSSRVGPRGPPPQRPSRGRRPAPARTVPSTPMDRRKGRPELDDRRALRRTGFPGQAIAPPDSLSHLGVRRRYPSRTLRSVRERTEELVPIRVSSVVWVSLTGHRPVHIQTRRPGSGAGGVVTWRWGHRSGHVQATTRRLYAHTLQRNRASSHGCGSRASPTRIGRPSDLRRGPGMEFSDRREPVVLETARCRFPGSRGQGDGEPDGSARIASYSARVRLMGSCTGGPEHSHT
jgi:hypothetical protein